MTQASSKGAAAQRLASQLFEQLQTFRVELNDDSVTFCQALRVAELCVPAGTPPEVEARGWSELLACCEELDAM